MNKEARNFEALKDPTLSKVNGGRRYLIYDIENNRGEVIGTHHEDGSITYYPCSHCRLPMHFGSAGLAYCNPCNNKEWYPEAEEWHSLEGQLVVCGSY